ncbi:MAG: hypothetical protein E6528_08730, partial [Staphylococcus sp.]|nr:hypothetical protein [Staphylococcus sp.]
MTDRYNNKGYRFSQTTYNVKQEATITSYFTPDNKEVIVINHLTKDVILNWKDKVYIFKNKSEFVVFYLKEAGYDLRRILYNSLSTPFLTAMNLSNSGQDVLFWQEPITDSVPGNMRLLLDSNHRQTKIVVQEYTAYTNLLKLVSPEQASVEYQVRDGQNELTNQAIQDKVNTILKDFNQRVIQMYFSSIVGNLVIAQQNVNQINDTQLLYQNQLEETIQQPFKEIPMNYTTVLSTASILDEDNKLFTNEQEAFVKSVQTLLESNNRSLESTSKTTEDTKKSVDEYSKEANEKIKKSIAQFNEQFERQKQELTNQWESDTTVYKQQFDQLNGMVINQFSSFYTPSEQGSSGIYADFLSESKLFQETQSNRIGELQKEIAELHMQVEQLTALKKQIAATYYNDLEATPEIATDTQIKQAIIQLITNEKENIPNLDKNYQERLEESLSEISFVSLERLVSELEMNNRISVEQGNLFRDELQIIQRYAEQHELDFTNSSRFMYLEPKQLHEDTIAIPQEKVTFSLATNQESVISLRQTNTQNGELSFLLDDSKVQTIKTSLNQQLAGTGYSID